MQECLSRYLGLVLLSDQTPGRIRRKASVGHDNDLLEPRWGDTRLQHLPPQAMLVPTTLRIDEAHSHRHPQRLPTGDQQDQLEATLIWLMLPVTGAVPQGMFAPSLRFKRTIAAEIEHAVSGWWQRPQRRSGHIREHSVGMPLPRPHPPAGGPRGQFRGPVGPVPLRNDVPWFFVFCRKGSPARSKWMS
jgi:hypothetical protein